MYTRNSIFFMFNLGKNNAETKELICQAYGVNAIEIYSVKNWFIKFINDKF